MIVENVNNNLVKHYSDSGYRLRQIETGFIYDEAIDVLPCPYTYEETEELIESPEDIEDMQAALELALNGGTR